MKKIRINLTTKFIILFLTVSLAPLLIAIYVSYDSSRKVLEEKTAYYFYGIIDNKINQIESYFLNRKNEIANLIKIPTIIEAVEKFNEVKKKNGINSSAYKKIDDEIRPILTYFKESLDYHDLILISIDGQLLFSIEQQINDLFLKNEELKILFNKSKALLTTEMSSFKYDETKQKLYAFIITPIIQESNLIGFGIFKIDHEGIYNIIQDYAGLGISGEIILAFNHNNNAVFIAPLRQEPGAPFTKQIAFNSDKQIDIQKALQGLRGWDITVDYKSEKTLAAWSYLPAFHWGMTAKMDLSEILEMAEDLKNRLLIIALILLIMTILITILMVFSVSKPIKKLTSVVADISQGNLSARVFINSNDEIEDLAVSFNQMTDNLLKTQNDLKNKSNQLTINLKNLNEEKEKVVQAKEKLDTILYGIGEGVFVLNKEKKINIFNREAQNISGFTSEKITGRKYNQYLKFVIEDKNKNVIDSDFIQKILNPEKIINFPNGSFLINKNGKKIPIQGSIAPLKNNFNELIAYVIVFRDITKEKEIDQAKTEFVSLASHQLRTPLSAINWYSEMLLDEEIGKINENQKKYLKSLSEASKRMVELVNSLLNVSRIELGTFVINPEPTNFLEIADSVIKEQGQQIKEKKLRLEKKYDLNLPIVNADPKLLRMIFQNLISNSVKYTPEGGNIDIIVKKQEKNILINVIDSGYGIPKNQQGKIFTKLFRADNVLEKDTDGNGLGLYIAKSVTEQSGGRIWFESEENKGTSFFVTIPFEGMRKKRGNKILINN
ncbi:MAG: ATP-binding protein [Patescibacteria group bacterium]|nr:ATP-binding protein [Patescibacteria group bacterium]